MEEERGKLGTMRQRIAAAREKIERIHKETSRAVTVFSGAKYPGMEYNRDY